MGVKDSKPCCLTYEDALKRVNDAELKRVKDAFKRVSNVNGFISKQDFVKDVLGEGVPTAVAEHIFTACGGTQKGIAFKDLLCGLVLLTRGRPDEKIKFLFSLYSNDSGTLISRDEIQRLLAKCENGCVPHVVASLFTEQDTATFEEFREWISTHSEATSLSRWLLNEPCSVTLSNEQETPTFYQTLAGVTHLEEKDIIELEKRYWTLKGQSGTGRFDQETLIPLLSPPVPLSVCPGIFGAFDENRDQHIDFKEIACGISAACRGPTAERQKFCFKVFDVDRDGILSPEEMRHMAEIFLFVRKESRSRDESASDQDGVTVESLVKDMQSYASGEGLTTEEYLMWTMDNQLSLHFLNLLFQVCHIVLGLRPQSRQEEGDIVNGWLEREDKRGYSVGQFWCLVSMDWWKAWNEYVSSPGQSALQGGMECLIGVDVTSPAGMAELLGQTSLMNHSSTVSNARLALQKATGGLTSSNSSLTHLTDSASGTPSPSHSPRSNRRYGTLNRQPQRPGAIDNSVLVAPHTYKVRTLTGEGGKLKRNFMLVRWRDFELVPDSLWRALSQWYGGSPALPRQVIMRKKTKEIELELYPLTLRLLRHQSPSARPAPQSSWTGMVGGYGAAALSTTGYAYVSNLPSPPKRYLAYVATFSCMATVKEVYDFLCRTLHIRPEDMRLWHYKDENNMTLMEDEEATLEDLGVCDDDQLLIEVRNKDLTWPEEMVLLAAQLQLQDRRRPSTVPAEKGATGLNNLGNTCFMNAALQCVSNTRALTQYFTGNMHLYELNRNNPLGMKGHIAKRYGDLIQDIWSGSAKTIAPLKLRWTISKYAPRFNGDQQHDSQELLAFLLDGLHEDLNRVHDKPYVELKDSDGRADVTVAQEAWENHILRNKSIVVDLFHGQLKSKVTCKVCSHESVTFDPFNYLSLPLPMESYVYVQVIVIKLDGSVPVKYGLRLNADDKYSALKTQLSQLCGSPAHLLKLAEVAQSQIKCLPVDDHKVKTCVGGSLFAYELPAFEGPLADDERTSICSVRSQREGQTLSAIQRALGPRTSIYSGSSVPVANGHATQPSCCDNASVAGDGSAGAGGEGSPSSSSKGNFSYNSSSGNLDESGSAADASSPIPRAVSGPAPGSSQGSGSSGSLYDMELSTPAHSGFIIAFHRKMIRQDVYFMSSQKTKPSLFGIPVIVPCSESSTNQDLYQSVWVQVARLVSPLPPSETAAPNHAQDCDDSLGYEFPFVLKAVGRSGLQCAWCPWYRFCRGCRIQCSDAEFNMSTSYLAIDWDPTALHLRYQTAQEKVFLEHPTVQETQEQQLSPIQLDSCLEAFTKEEHLTDDEKYYCSKCRSHQLASKKLQIWRLPPILIVHLKRFQFVNGKWVKSQKVVNFPMDNFNPTQYLAAVPQQTVYRHHQLQAELAKRDVNIGEEGDCGRVSTPLQGSHGPADPSRKSSLSRFHDSHENKPGVIWENANGPTADSNGDGLNDMANGDLANGDLANGDLANGDLANGDLANGDLDLANGDLGASRGILRQMGRKRLISTSLIQSPVVDSALQDFHQHRLKDKVDPFDLKYRLYAVVCHSGILGGGHYVSYACNPNGKWYCYNDSSCREVSMSQMDTSCAYMLFYEREGLCQDDYMPNIAGKVLDKTDLDDEWDSDLRRTCSLM